MRGRPKKTKLYEEAVKCNEVKVCGKCAVEKPVKDFYCKLRKDGVIGIDYECKECKKETQKIHRAHPEIKEKRRLAAQEYNKRPEVVDRRKRLYEAKLPIKRFQIYKQGAKRRSLNWNLSLEEFEILIKNTCYYCGTDYNVGVDRVDSSQDYVFNNCVPCCTLCNYSKGTQSVDEFLVWIKKVYEYQTNKNSRD